MNKEIAILPTESEFSMIKEMALISVKSKFNPGAISTAESAMFIMLKGREVGVSPLVALAHIHIISGKPTLSAELMLAAIYAAHPNAEIYFDKNETQCVLRAKRPSEKEFSIFTWNMSRAKKMGLDQKDNWRKQPENMLFWRCVSEMKRAKFPEILMGISYFREELEDEGMKEVTPSISDEEAAKILETRPLPDSPQDEPINVEPAPSISTAQETQPDATIQSPDDSRETLKAEIGKERKRLGWSAKVLTEAIYNNFKKAPAELTNDEMIEFLELMMES